jgi:hypothetical protein
MSEPDNIYDKIQELLGTIPGNLNILEQQIDADVQLEYYQYTQKIEENFDAAEVIKNKDLIFQSDQPIHEKKKLLVQLANVDSIEAYRTLEKFIRGSRDSLKEWATLALQESRLLIESKLLDKNQILISTGLGGKGMKLRYFTVILTLSGNDYSDFEKKIVANEMLFYIKKSKGELESLIFDKEICTILSIIPLQIAVQNLFNECIKECNHYGNFLKSEFIITNVKTFSNDQIRKMISGTRKKTKPESNNASRL